jgi:hypothetical protein
VLDQERRGAKQETHEIEIEKAVSRNESIFPARRAFKHEPNETNVLSNAGSFLRTVTLPALQQATL